MKMVRISCIFKYLRHRLGLLHLRKYREQLSAQPLDSEIHFNCAKAAIKFGLANLALAELRSAEYLGFDRNRALSLHNIIKKSLSDLTQLDVNQYKRFAILQSHLNKLLKSKESILDIGGGYGILSQFMPDNHYFLVEPSVNGVSALKLPFTDHSFDAVVACHVLEHIEPEERTAFIDELVRVAKKYVLILNPFKNKDLDEIERLRLVLEVTKAGWAAEHIKCGLPIIDETTDYLSSKGLIFSIKPYGDIYTAVATVFMSYFARRINKGKLDKINRHLNLKYDHMGSSKYPTNIMIIISPAPGRTRVLS